MVVQGPREYAGVVGEGDAVTYAYLESLQGPAVDLCIVSGAPSAGGVIS